jgi:parallel beta-helix repeat protein
MGSFIVVADNNITNTKESSIGRAYAIDGYGVSDGCVICRNNISGNGDSVALQRFFNAVFSDNYLADNGGPGLYVLVASNCTVSGNHIANSVDCGIETRGCNNSLFTENEIQNNSVGVSLQRSYYNGLYRNSFVNNTQQVYTADSANYWDDGYSSGGNYWSDGAADDKYQGSNQTVVGSDGICDLEYSLDANNTDHYPLMGKYLKFNTTSEDHIETICNSTISDFKYNGTAILFNVSSMTGTTGFCRICIPENLLGDSFEVYVNGTKTEAEILSCSNTTHKYIYFVYTHSKEEVIIIPELHQLLLLQIFAIAVPVVIFRQKRRSS